jgi:acyl-CoA reductase-like NAD-dependent aldehyde dehydrogenase
VACASDATVQSAVARARAASAAWGSLSVDERLRALGRLERLVVDHIEDVVEAISADTGKPRVEALMTEGVPAPLFMNWFRKHAAGVLAPRRLRTPLEFAPRQAWVEHFPMGVVAVISPWNFPFQLSLTPALSALVAGNTVVLKPSEVTPRVAYLLTDLVRRADLGDGVFEVVEGDGATGAALCASDVDKIFFTGSLATGRKVMAQAATRPIPVELELGGKDAFLVMEDAPLERAARAAVWGAFMNAGQMCISVERVFVHANVYDAFCARVRELMAGITIGPPTSESDMGPLTYERQLEVFRRHVDQAQAAGAAVESIGTTPDGTGWYVPPTLVTGVEPGMAIYDEESFAPVLPVLRFESLDEAISLINSHTYGLNASVWTSSIARGRTIASRIRAGQVHINDVVSPVGNPSLPFGGVGGSGFGRYHGEDGLLAFVNRRGVSASPSWWPSEPFWFPYRGKYPAARQLFDHLARGSVAGATNALLQMARVHRKTQG